MANYKQPHDQNKDTNDKGNTDNRGFASMPKEKVQEIGRKGGEARAEQAGPEGMAEMGRKGGERSHSSSSSQNKGGKRDEGDQNKR